MQIKILYLVRRGAKMLTVSIVLEDSTLIISNQLKKYF